MSHATPFDPLPPHPPPSCGKREPLPTLSCGKREAPRPTARRPGAAWRPPPAPAPDHTPATGIGPAAVNPIPGLFTIAPADRDHEVGLRVGVTVLVPLLVLLATHRMDLAVYAVFGAFTGIYGRNLRHDPRLRAQLRGGGLMLAVLAAATLAGRLGVAEQADPWGLVLWTTVVAGVCAFVTGWWGLRPAGSLFHIFAFGAVASVPVKPLAAEGMLTAVVVVVWALAVGMASRVHPGRRHRIVWPDPVLHDDGARRLILWEAAWYVVAAGVAGVVATLLAAPAGVHHNYWAMVAAVVPLVGHSTRYRVSRGLQRVIGTFLGLVLTAGIILLDPPVIVLVLIIAVLQVAAELYIARQYVIAQTVVTPLALLSTMLVGVTAGGAGSLMAAGGLQHLADRGVETVIGAAVGIVCVLFPWAWRRWVWGSPDPARAIPVVRGPGS